MALALGLGLVATGCGAFSEPASKPAVAPFRPLAELPTQPAREGEEGSVSAEVTGRVALRARPGGKVLARLGRRTEFGSRRVFAVARTRGDWLGVRTTERQKRLGWIHASRVRLGHVTESLTIDLSERELTLRRGRRTVMRTPVAIGRPGTPTPLGRFAVTDRLAIRDPGSPYGCCALALTARQPNIPQGWIGGDRIAIHATGDEWSIGRPASLGCLRVESRAMKRLMRLVPLATPVDIRR